MAIPESRQLDFDEIPVIDISGLLDKSETVEIISKIDTTCRDVGFFWVYPGFPKDFK